MSGSLNIHQISLRQGQQRTNSIQIDMFDVQLGAALLMQFRNTDGQVVRVLADAGVDPRSGYHQNHVLGPLNQAMGDFDPTNKRIDLVIGTHYDADHLEGMIPIVSDRSIEITEVWMPPVANDTDQHALDELPQEPQLLANQFDSEQGRDVLLSYIVSKRTACEQLRLLEGIADKFQPHAAAERERIIRQASPSDRYRDDWVERELSDFYRHVDEAAATIGEGSKTQVHADEDIQSPPDRFPLHFASDYDHPDSGRLAWWVDHWLWSADQKQIREYWSRRPERAALDARGLAFIRRSTARDAITAGSLFKVVQAFRTRSVPICCRIIDNGVPRRFVWRRDQSRFVEGAQLLGSPEFTLLGPSRGLVKKHWDRLPIGDYARMTFSLLLPSKSITPSNQLSYVARFGFQGQGILVSGDAGCVDFAPARSSRFYKSLLDVLLPLHVIQVAHHGGRNAQFYNVLLSAHYASQSAPSALLLSHATDDASRPSDLFSQFVAAVRKNVDNVQILFTSRPRRKFVRDYQTLIAPAVGVPKAAGDVRLAFDGQQWNVKKHSVQI
jgi:beta-lactamase superfamily II metal-dependent hydrolase